MAAATPPLPSPAFTHMCRMGPTCGAAHSEGMKINGHGPTSVVHAIQNTTPDGRSDEGVREAPSTAAARLVHHPALYSPPPAPPKGAVRRKQRPHPTPPPLSPCAAPTRCQQPNAPAIRPRRRGSPPPPPRERRGVAATPRGAAPRAAPAAGPPPYRRARRGCAARHAGVPRDKGRAGLAPAAAGRRPALIQRRQVEKEKKDTGTLPREARTPRTEQCQHVPPPRHLPSRCTEHANTPPPHPPPLWPIAPHQRSKNRPPVNESPPIPTAPRGLPPPTPAAAPTPPVRTVGTAAASAASSCSRV